MVPTVDVDGQATARHIVAFATTLIPVSLFPVFLGMTGKLYLTVALLLGGYFLYTALRMAISRTGAEARWVLRASVAYLPILLAILMIDSR